jgi:hypothetical protein
MRRLEIQEKKVRRCVFLGHFTFLTLFFRLVCRIPELQKHPTRYTHYKTFPFTAIPAPTTQK